MKQNYVQIGRVALVNFGALTGKLCVIVEVVDANRVLVDGPKKITGVPRVVLPVRRLQMTNFLVHIPHSAPEAVVAKAMEDAKIVEEFGKTSWARKLQQREKRAAMNDFDRFKVGIAKKKVNHKIRVEMAARIKKHNKSVDARLKAIAAKKKAAAH